MLFHYLSKTINYWLIRQENPVTFSHGSCLKKIVLTTPEAHSNSVMHQINTCQVENQMTKIKVLQ